MRVAALADLHCTKTSQGAFQTALRAYQPNRRTSLLIAGDLTDYGLPEEARVLAHELTALRIPAAAVLGNHDLESGKPDEVRQILADAGLVVLDGDACELHGIGIAGVKGFGGGFGRRALGPWGETIIKQFVHEAVDEALKLEAALGAAAHDARSIALLHYAPIQQTVEGEPLEIYPFLGSSRLEEPIGRYPGVARRARPRAPRPARRAHQERRAGLQRLDAAADADVRRSPAVPRLRGAGRRRTRRPLPSDSAAPRVARAAAAPTDAVAS